MEREEAVKKLAARKPKGNYMLVSFGYDKKYILPYQDGLAFMASFANAESLLEEYGKPTRIAPVTKDGPINYSPYSHQEYARLKLAAILNIDPEEIDLASLDN